MIAALLAGCNDSVTVGNNNPTGLVGGIVVDAAHETPIEGATVKIVSAEKVLEATTTADGQFTVRDVPAGSYIISISQAGFLTASFNDTLGGNVGNFPVSNPTRTLGPIGLVKNGATFTVRVVDEGGAPAEGIPVKARPQVRWVDFSSGSPVSRGAVELTATSNADGAATFMGMPGYAELGGVVSDVVFFDVAPMKVMGSEVYEFLGASVPMSLNALGSTVPTIVLAGPNTPLQVLHSNVEYIRSAQVGPTGSVVPAGGPISVVFNQAINPATVRAQLQTELGQLAPVQPMATAQLNSLTITPAMALTPGQRYNLVLHVDAARATRTQTEFNVVAPFFVAQNAGVNVTATGKLESPSPTDLVLRVTFNEPVGVGSGTSAPRSCIAFYESPVELDGVTNPNAPFPGEWGNGDVGRLACFAGGSTLDITAMTPAGEAAVVTGFVTQWIVRLGVPGGSAGTNGCKSIPPPAITNCIQPGSGHRVHLIFSKQPVGATFRRVSGQPLDDRITFTIQ